MNEPKIEITIITADKKISESISGSIKDSHPYKYLHNKLLVARLRGIKQEIAELPIEQQASIIRNVLIAERNIAETAAEQYALLNANDIFNDLMEIVGEINNLLTL